MTQHPCVMVVDDDKDIQRIVSRALELEGFDVVIAGDGNSALTLLEERKPKLVILDITMPRLDGYSVIKAIRKHHDTPIIMLTARVEISSLEKALNLGADDYIKKPFSTKVLVARVRAKLRRA